MGISAQTASVKEALLGIIVSGSFQLLELYLSSPPKQRYFISTNSSMP
jgi:hypothetical protein